MTVTSARELSDEFMESTGPQRTLATLAGALSAIALVIVSVGVYGLLAYDVRQRTSEIGLRMALGATPRSILRLIGLQGFRLVASGAAFGLLGTLVAVRFVQSFLFGVEVSDPATWLAVCVVMMAAALVACAIPAVRALRTAPSVALRA
jgi:putative ABC transport system permease protein